MGSVSLMTQGSLAFVKSRGWEWLGCTPASQGSTAVIPIFLPSSDLLSFRACVVNLGWHEQARRCPRSPGVGLASDAAIITTAVCLHHAAQYPGL